MAENKISLSKKQVELIEEFAHVNETLGLQPAMSKILGLLVVSDDPELTFDQIRDTLALSKSAVSHALSHLLASKRVSYKTRIGDRKRYFHLRVADWDAQILEQFNGISSLIAVYKKVIQMRTDKTTDFNEGLGKMTDFLTMLHNQVVASYQKYQSERK